MDVTQIVLSRYLVFKFDMIFFFKKKKLFFSKTIFFLKNLVFASDCFRAQAELGFVVMEDVGLSVSFTLFLFHVVLTLMLCTLCVSMNQ